MKKRMVRRRFLTGAPAWAGVADGEPVPIGLGKAQTEPKSLAKSIIGPEEVPLYTSNNHKANLIECIRTRRQPAAHVEIGHRSCTVCLLGSIAMRVGRKLRWNPDMERFVDDPKVDRWIAPPIRAPWWMA